MAKFGFLSHADMSIYFFRAPIMRELKRLGHEVFAIAPKGDYTDRLKSEFNCVTYELDRASLNPLTVLENSKKLAEILRGLSLDLLQTSAHKSNVFGTFAAKKAGIKRVINLVEGLGSFYIDNDLKTRLVRAAIETLYKKALKMSDGCVFVNEADPAYFLARELIAEEKIFKIKSVGVDTLKFDENSVAAANLGEDLRGKKIVLMIARAMWHKGVREFYEAAELLRGRDDVPELLKASYLLALPSYKEGFPRTVLEAMSMGRAVVASDVAGCNEAVTNGFNGLLCEAKNSADLAAKIEILLNDENLAARMGRNGRELAVREFDERAVARKYIEIYRKFIDV